MASVAVTERSAGLRLRFTLAILCGSFLLFLVQPMIARMALPRLGGAPAVWNSAMLVYQALLLGGYAYAHWLGRFSPRVQAGVHLALLAAAAMMLPLGLVASEPSANANPFLWTPWLLVVSIGPLFFAVAAQAPLLQRWFAVSGGGDPYPLYAASNLGSFAGLIAYPLLVEPILALHDQSLAWSIGYVVLIGFVIVCALVLPRGVSPVAAETPRTPIAAGTVVTWLLLAAVPSGLMLSTTTHLTTDIVAMPLLWVLPLGLYLLSFSVAFAENRRLANTILSVAPLIILMGGGVAFAENPRLPWLFAPLGLILLFVVSVALHTMMYDRRPDPSRLTAFYLTMSAGGVLGGIFCALVAPLVFDWAYEHPLLIIASGALVTSHPLFGFTARFWANPARKAIWIGLIGLLISMVAGGLTPLMTDPAPLWVKIICTIAVIDLAILSLGSRAALGFSLAALMLTMGGWEVLKTSLNTEARVRSYFGIYTVSNTPAPARMLVHGTTVHGLQSLIPGREREPLSYYAPESGVGLAMRALAKPGAQVGVVGLGSGTLACYTKPGEHWRFYEIDPAMAAIARDPVRFTFLSRCNPQVPVEIGDARLTLAHEGGPPLDRLIIDAFSSDAVPMHLLTREAFAIYQRRLAPDGVLMVHISNRFMDLEPVIAAARQWGWYLAVRSYTASPADLKKSYTGSLWVALTRDPAALSALVDKTGREKWRAAQPRPGFGGWTDDHASILPLLKWETGH